MLSFQDNLIGKLIAVNSVAEVVDAMSLILITTEQDIEQSSILPLTKAEKDLTLTAAREFMLTFDTMMSLDKNPEFFREDQAVPGWLVRYYFKPNMTLNASVPLYLRLRDLALLKPEVFAHRMDSQPEMKLTTNPVRNWGGYVLLRFQPDYEEYIARLQDLDVKLTLFNQYVVAQVEPEAIANPYYPDQSAYQEKRSICTSGPLEDTKRLRCLPSAL
jgi:hypothetical protein